jgi:DNA-binding beta-propeller fold protein YncE
LKGAKEDSVVGGGNKREEQPNQFRYPQDLSFDRENNLYVVDCRNHRVSKFCLDLS